MDYPVICLIEENTNNKAFIVPQMNSVMEFAKTIKGNDEQKLDFGIKVLLSTLPSNTVQEEIPSHLKYNDVSVHTLTVSRLEKGLERFECATLFSPNDYECMFVMNNTSMKNLEARDWDAINEIVSINRDETPVIKSKIKIH